VISNVDVCNEVVTQSYDPVTGKITILERRPKGLTPGEARPQPSTVDLGGTVATRVFDPATGTFNTVSTEQKTAAPSAPTELARLQAERDALPFDDPRRNELDKKIAKETEKSEPARYQEWKLLKEQGYKGSFQDWIKEQAILSRAPAQPPAPAPLERAFDTQTNSQVFVDRADIRANPDRYKPLGAEEKLRPIPETINKGLTGNVASISQIDRAIDAVTKNPDSVGIKGNLPQAILNRTDPKGVEARALVTDVGSAKVHDRSGAAVAASEAPRLMPFIPQATDDAATVIKKLKQLKTQIETEQSGILDFYSQEQGYKPSLYHKKQNAPAEPAATPATRPSAANPVAQPVAAASTNIPQAAIDFLKQGKGTRQQFDEQFGAGAAKKVLGN
jgi:hypothetical protein